MICKRKYFTLTSLKIGDLNILKNERIGPRLDSPLCNYDTSSCLPGATLSLTDYATKIMHILPGGGLIVCATMKQGIRQIRESLPLVSTRQPPNYDVIGAGSLEGEAAVHIRAEYRSRFRVYFVTAFFHEHYVYYLSVQNKYLSNGKPPFTVSKLIRICRDEYRLNLFF
uniref:tRNA (adenine(58)-N(1))-methyltransferase n=1 Tax=Elaeophora elaphi TaxID=1147741 RepID=A0A0R3RZR8_9BILA